MEEEKIIGGISHVVIAVRDSAKAQKFFSEFMDTKFREVPENKEVGFTSVISENRLEILSPTRPDSDVAKFINKRGEGVYAIGFKTPDLKKARARAEKMGIRVVGGAFMGGDEDSEFGELWLHPKDVFGMYTLLARIRQ
jgi:methylmalonyl-CoA/ethylmalonyl-CoA epimerase